MYNYAGYACAALALAHLVRGPRRAPVVALAVAGAIALVLAIGPAFKTGQVAAVAPGAVSYSMPAGLAPELPWDRLFTALPGLKDMRATYRWFAVTRFALVFLAGLCVAGLLSRPRRRTRALGLLLAAACAAELAPNLPLMAGHYGEAYRAQQGFRRDVVAPLRRDTRRGERDFLLSDDGTHNDYLANYLVSLAGVRSYNVGGDKNALISLPAWPPDVKALEGPGVPPDAVARALADHQVDAVVAPFFHLAQSSYHWPALPAERAAAQAAFAPLLADRRFAVRRSAWFAVLRLRRG
jgi:hypothetical protein